MPHELAYQHAACALLTCTSAGEVLSLNSTLLRWVGREADAAPKTLYELFTPASLLFFEMQLRPLLALGRTIDGGFLTLRHHDGTTVPVVLNGCQSPDGQRLELAMIVVREREQYEEGLRQSQQSAERALDAMSASAHGQKMQAVGQMAAGVAHEFNNLLAVIRGNIVFAQGDVRATPIQTARVLDDLDSALTATDRAASIVRQLLAFTGRQVVARTRLDLNALVHDASPLLTTTLGRDVTWQTRLATGLWEVFAPADQLHHVLTNLVLNARDAIHASGAPGLVTILTENIERTEGAGDMVRLTVADTGTGMSADVRARAFDPFFTTKPVGQGLGLGLSMVYGTIDALGGHTRIESAEGRGTRLVVELPRTRD